MNCSENSLTLQDLMYGVGITDPATWTSQVKMKNHPYPWQFDTMKEAISTITQHDRFGDFSDAGTGKTFPMQFVSVVFASYGNKVVCVTHTLRTVLRDVHGVLHRD